MSKTISLSKPAQTNNEELLTTDEIRSIKGCEDFTDEQAQNAVETIVTFALLIVRNLLRNTAPLENHHSIPVTPHSIAA